MIRVTALILLLAPSALAQSFQYTNFTGATGLVLNGNAAISGANLRVSDASASSNGSAYFETQVALEGGFDTSFDFEFTAQGAGGADGLAFLIHNDSRGTAFLGNHGSAMGYSGYSTSPAGTGLTNAVVVEFDTWSSGVDGVIATNDASATEISVHTGGSGEVHHSEGMSLGQIDTVGALGINFADSLIHTARIFYVPGQLEVYLDGMLALSIPYDLTTGGTWVNGDFGGTPAHTAGAMVGGLSLTSGSGWVGFTAAAGGAWENHDVRSWSFASGASAYGVCNGDGGNQIGCTACPCNNNASVGTKGGCLNSMAVSSALLRAGSSSVSAGTLRFNAEQIPPARACHLFSGTMLAPNNPANPCFGMDSGVRSNFFDGMRCVVGGIQRHGVRMSDVAGDVGATNAGWGTPDPFANFTAFTTGSTWMFQMMYTDNPLAMCMTGRNTTQAVPVTMTP